MFNFSVELLNLLNIISKTTHDWCLVDYLWDKPTLNVYLIAIKKMKMSSNCKIKTNFLFGPYNDTFKITPSTVWNSLPFATFDTFTALSSLFWNAQRSLKLKMSKLICMNSYSIEPEFCERGALWTYLPLSPAWGMVLSSDSSK